MSEIEPVIQPRDEGNYSCGQIVFSKFEIIEFVGSGNKGRVYKARDIHRDSVVALKVLVTDSRREKTLMRFQSEARIASKLKHRGIVTVLDFGMQDDIPYLAMEFVEGENLKQVLKRRKTLSLLQFLDVFCDVCPAIEHAHRNEVIHRDIKPENISIRQEADGKLAARILDFGIAKRLDVNEEMGGLTPQGELLGTPLYMSPEQISGGELTNKSDLYSLGCVMYESLAGRPPHSAESAMETFFLHQNELAEPLADCAANKNIPDNLTDAIDALLSKKPEDRPEIQHLIELLEECLEDEEKSTEAMERESLSAVVSESEPAPLPKKPLNRKTVSIVGACVFVFLAIVSAQIIRISQQDHTRLKPQAPIEEMQDAVDHMPEFVVSNTIRKKADSVSIKVNCENYHLEPLARNPYIVSIEIEQSPKIDDGCMKTLKTLRNLKTLKLRGTSIRELPGINQLKLLNALDLQDNPILTNEAYKNFIGLDKLSYLVLSRANPSVQSLEALQKLPSLSRLDLAVVKLTDEQVTAISHLKQLQQLDLEYTDINASKLLVLSKLPEIRTLRLAGKELTPENTASLKLFKKLYQIDLAESEVDSKQLSDAAKGFPGLLILGLRSCNSPNWDATIDSILKFKKLTQINVENTAISAQQFQKLCSSPSMVGIYFAGCVNVLGREEKFPGENQEKEVPKIVRDLKMQYPLLTFYPGGCQLIELFERADAANKNRHFEKAIELIDESIESLSKSKRFPPDSVHLVRFWDVKATALGGLGRVPEAEKLFRKSINVAESNHKPELAVDPALHMALVKCDTAGLAAGKPLLLQALAKTKQALGRYSGQYDLVLQHLIVRHMVANDRPGARPYLVETIAIRKQTQPKNSSPLAFAYIAAGDNLRYYNIKTPTAYNELKQGIDILMVKPVLDDVDKHELIRGFAAITHYCILNKRYEEALEWNNTALRIFEQQRIPETKRAILEKQRGQIRWFLNQK